MTFPNAFSGVKKIFTAQVLMLIGTILLAIVGVSAGAVVSSGASISINVGAGLGAGAAAVALISAILILVAYVMNLVGLYQSGKDEARYLKPAFIISIIVLVLAIIGGFFSDNLSVQTTIRTISSVAQLIVMILTIIGIGELAKQLNQMQVASFGNKVLILVIVGQVISLIAGIIGSGNAAMAVAFVGSIFTIIAYVAFIVFLSKGKNMLSAF